MSTHCFIFRIPKGIGLASVAFLSTLSVLGMILPTLLFSSSVAIAFSLHHAASPPPSEDVGRAGVSVVRLLVTYSTLTTAPSAIQCSGLGTIVASWPAQSPTDLNSWVLTDGALVNPQEADCLPTPAKARLDSIGVLLSTAYNPKAGEQGNVISLIATPTSPLTIQCAVPGACQNGPALVVFATPYALPFIDRASAELAQADFNGIELSQKADAVEGPAAFNTEAKAVTSYAAQVLHSSIPTRARINLASSTAPIDAGLPLVDVHGKLLSILLKKAQPTTSQQLTSFLTQQPGLRSAPVNPVHDHWQAGISAFYQGPSHYAQANSEFQAVLKANPQFLGVQTFLHFTAPTAGSASPPNGSSQLISFFSSHSPLSMLAVGSGALVGVLILLTLVTLVRRRSLQLRLHAGYAGAQQTANAVVEEERRKQPQASSPVQTPAQQIAPPPNPFLKGESLSSPDSRCPRCGIFVAKNAPYCPNCHLQLAPTPWEVQSSPPKPQPPATPVPLHSNAEPIVPVPLHVHPLSTPDWPVSQESVISSIPAEPPLESAHQQEVSSYPKREEELKKTGRVGQRLGNYRLIGLLGYGGFAEVYLGEHVFLKTQAAIKVLQVRLSSHTLESFLAEARTIAGLIHPHIVRVLEFGVEGHNIDLEQSRLDVEGSLPYLIMDYAPGGTLRKRHPKGARLPIATIVPYVKQVAEALQYAHEKKLIHRDVKPENMLIGRNNEALLSDFGIAVIAHSERSMTTQEMAGTVPYMAPEQIKGKPRPASDQYALGVVVYEWLCGLRPFQGDTQWEIMEQHMQVPPPYLRERIPSIAPKLEAVVLKALAKDPLQRFESVAEFADALAKAAE